VIVCEDVAMASLHTLERRIAALEARLAEVEGGYGDAIYKIHRVTVRTSLSLNKILDHLHIEPVSDEQVDEVLDQE
jgi:hypothetical protein